MSQSSSMNPEGYIEIDENDMAAQLVIYVTNEGEVMYNCDWKPEEEGLMGIASIFYKLLSENLSEQILAEIKTECVSNNNTEDFISISNLMQVYSATQNKDETNDEVVVPPDRIMNI